MATKPQSAFNDASKKKRKQTESIALSSDSEIETEPKKDPISFPRFLVVEPKDDNSFEKVSPFAIAKSVQCNVGTVKSVKKMQSGSLLIEVSTLAYAGLVLKLETLAGIPVTATPHRTLNSSRGVIRCRDLRDCDDAEVLEELGCEGVVAVKHMTMKRDGKTEPTNTFILTFNTPNLPTHVKVGYLRVQVDQFIPGPLRCFKCQHYGHGRFTCRRPETCARCGEEGHTDQACGKPAKCANCSGDHPAYSKQCPHWKKQAEITKVKTEQGISFRDAQDIVEKRTGPQAGSYASKASSSPISKNPGMSPGNVHVACQTDLTWLSASEAPLLLTSVSSPTLSLVAEAASQTAQPASKVNEPTAPANHTTAQISSTSSYPPSLTNASPSISPPVAPKPTLLNPARKNVSELRSNTGKKPPAESQIQKGATASSKPENRFLALQTDAMDTLDALEKEKKHKQGPKIKPPDKAPQKS